MKPQRQKSKPRKIAQFAVAAVCVFSAAAVAAVDEYEKRLKKAQGLLDRQAADEHTAADRRLHEVPYSHVLDGRVESGIIDALYLKDGVWTIVEFKTDQVRNEAELERLLAAEDYLAQAQRYTAAAGNLLDNLIRYAGRRNG